MYKKGDTIRVKQNPEVCIEHAGDTYVVSEYLEGWDDMHGKWYRILLNGEFHVNIPEIDIEDRVKNTRLARKMYPNAEVSEDGEYLIGVF